MCAQLPGGAEADVAAACDDDADGAPSPGGGGDLRHVAPRGARGQGGERGAGREQAGGRQGEGGAAAHAYNLTKEILSPKCSRDLRSTPFSPSVTTRNPGVPVVTIPIIIFMMMKESTRGWNSDESLPTASITSIA